MPFPGTRVIHEQWSRHHQPVATGGMNATCVITDPARSTPGAWNDTTGTYDPPTPFYVLTTEGGWPCRVQALNQDGATEQAGQSSSIRSYLVQLDDPDVSTVPDIEAGHDVTVTAATNDAHLVDLELAVVDVQHGSERFTRDLVVEHNQQPTQTT